MRVFYLYAVTDPFLPLHTGLCTGMCLLVEALCKEGPKCSEYPEAVWVGLSEWGWQTAVSSKHSVGALKPWLGWKL